MKESDVIMLIVHLFYTLPLVASLLITLAFRPKDDVVFCLVAIVPIFNWIMFYGLCEECYTKKRALNLLYFLPVLSLGLLWIM